MNAIISNGDYTAHIQLPVDQKQLAGALSYLGANHASAYDIKKYFGLSYPDAVRSLLGNNAGEEVIGERKPPSIKPKKPFELPEKHTDIEKCLCNLTEYKN